MLLGLSLGFLLARGITWATDGAIAFWQTMIPVAISSIVVPLWNLRAERRELGNR